MGRKTSRDLWTAKLSGSGGLASGKPTGGSAPALNRSTGTSVPALSKLAGGSARPSVAGKHQAGMAQAAPAARRESKATQRAAAAVGVRVPFHGVVLGIDPSLRGTGIAVMRFSPPEEPRLLFSTTVRNKPSLSPAQCLGNIARTVTEVLETYRPLCVALEQTVYVQNVRTSLTMGSARGAAIAPAAMLGLEIFEYAPKRLKQAVVGNGRASKEQVAAMVKSLVQAGRDLLPSDEADAAAAAICHAYTVRS